MTRSHAPLCAPSKYCILGDGKLARHLVHYLSLLGVSQERITRWNRRSGFPLHDSLQGATHALLAVSDRAIEELAQQIPPGKVVIHFSGALRTPFAHGLHPLMTFGERLYSAEKYREIPFVTETGAPRLRELLPELPNPEFELDPAKKALYHAYCVMSGNFPALLWAKAFEAFPAELGLPPGVLLPYLRQISENLLATTESSRKQLTGPIVRGDQGTIEKNLSALSAQDRSIYQAFVERFSQI